MTTGSISTRDIVMVGEPGCYLVPGHLDDSQMLGMLRAIMDLSGEGLDGLSMPRHTWMRVTAAEDNGGGFDVLYAEVRENDEGAQPSTLVAVEGYWLSPDERLENERQRTMLAFARTFASDDPVSRGESTAKLGGWVYSCRHCHAAAEKRQDVIHTDGCRWLHARRLFGLDVP